MSQGPYLVVLSNAIGDSLMMMSLAHNMVRHGLSVKVCGWVADQLRDWYPWCDVIPAQGCPSSRDSQSIIVELHPRARGASLILGKEAMVLSSDPGFSVTGKHMIDRILDTGARLLHLPALDRGSGVVRPAEVFRASEDRRVVIHPTASHPEKTWLQSRYIKLACGLAHKGFEPSFLVLPSELSDWRGPAGACGVPVHAFDSLSDVAACIARAGWFFGNDSGPGHLASAIGVPTVSLFMRGGLARTWRPRWSSGCVVLPIELLPGARLRERHWQRLLSVRRVLNGFNELRRDVSMSRTVVGRP